MAEANPKKKTHKEWRKEVKKIRRKKNRQKFAEERKKKLAEEEESRLNDSQYQDWLKHQEELELVQREHEERQRQEQEELWLRRELLAQKKFREQQQKLQATIAAKEAERVRIQKEFEELQQKAQKRREERQQREEQAKRDHEQMLQRIADYIEHGGAIPEELTSNVQSNPNKELCPFFSKTNACRFGMHCCRNHIRPKLSRILFIPNFFTHINFIQGNEAKSGLNTSLEITERELHNDYVEFFNDVIEELKKFGEIENFRTCMNSQPHLRGNVLVEYCSERGAMKAFMSLQGRYYASRRINVEFSPIVTWKSAICGLSFKNKCPKGRNCNFLHIFRNPGNVYNVSVYKQEESVRKTNERQNRDSSVMSWNDGNDRSSKRNWRWSESPEPRRKSDTTTRRSTESSSKKRKESPRSKSRRSRSSERRHRTDERNHQNESSRRSTYSSRDSRHSISRSGRSEQTARSERTERSERSERSERAERSGRAEKSERAERSERTEGSKRAERSERKRSKSRNSSRSKKRHKEKSHKEKKKHKHKSKKTKS